MEIKETSIIGAEVLSEKETMLVGISINNGYFNVSNLEKLLVWASENAKFVYVTIFDEPAIHTQMALGKSFEKVRRAMRLKKNNLENKCDEIIKRLRLSQNSTTICWENIFSRKEYVESLCEIKQTYLNHKDFRDAVNMATGEVLSNNLQRNPTELEVYTGSMFLLEELAYISRSNLIHHATKIAYVYHKTMPVLKKLLENKYSFKSSQVGFITAE
jgi:tRNA-dependent cyclodipeptide synthase